MYQRLLSTAIAIAVLLITTGPGFAMDPDKAEARKMFETLSQSNNPYIAKLASQNLNELEKGAKKQVEVPFLSRNNATMAVPAVLNGHVMGTFLVDTGATHTVVTPRIAKKLGVDTTNPKREIKIITANGTVKAPVVDVPTITIGGVEVHNVEVVVTPLGNDILLAGLLGMNFFKDMEITFKKDRLILTVDESVETATNR